MFLILGIAWIFTFASFSGQYMQLFNAFPHRELLLKNSLLHQFSGYSLETLSYGEWQNERVSKQTDVKLVRQWITDSICLYESLQLLIS